MRTLPALFLTSAALCAATSALAAPLDGEQRERMPESVQHIEDETGGRVLQVRPIQRGNREIYRMKVLTPEGRVRFMQDDPRQRLRESRLPPRELTREERMRQDEPRQRLREPMFPATDFPPRDQPSQRMQILQEDPRQRLRESRMQPRETQSGDFPSREMQMGQDAPRPVMPEPPPPAGEREIR